MTGAPISPISVSIVKAAAIICKGESILKSQCAKWQTRLSCLSRQMQVTGEQNRGSGRGIRTTESRIKICYWTRLNALEKLRSDPEKQNEGWKAGKCSRPAGSGICLLGRVSIVALIRCRVSTIAGNTGDRPKKFTAPDAHHCARREVQALSTTCRFLLTSGAPAPAPGQKLLSLGSQGGENHVPPKVPIMIEPRSKIFQALEWLRGDQGK